MRTFGHARIVFKLQVKVTYMSESGLLKFHGPVSLKFKSHYKKKILITITSKLKLLYS